jgi:hypothetical protein
LAAGRVDVAEDFRGTVFEAAVDAAEGKAWQRDSPVYCHDRWDDGQPQVSGKHQQRVGLQKWWSTQSQGLLRLTRWLGVAVEQSDNVRERVAAALGVALLVLVEQVSRVQQRPGYRSRGSAVMAVVAHMTRDSGCYGRLLAAGYEAALLRPALFWDPDRGQMRHIVFPQPEPRGPP